MENLSHRDSESESPLLHKSMGSDIKQENPDCSITAVFNLLSSLKMEIKKQEHLQKQSKSFSIYLKVSEIEDKTQRKIFNKLHKAILN